MTEERPRAALWLRVSTRNQHTENQRRDLLRMAEARGFDVVREFDLVGISAWQGPHKAALDELCLMAHRGEISAVLVWSLDRLDRGGVASMLNTVKQIEDSGARLLSYSEQWADTAGDLRDLFYSMAGWFANYESRRRSERIKAAQALKVAQGGKLGRPVGARDKKKRKRRAK